MTTHFEHCAVLCSRGAKERLWLQAPTGAEMLQAWEFGCPDCHTTWSALDFDGALEPQTVRCSNCYGKHVLVTKMRYVLLEQSDFEDSPGDRAITK